MTIAPPEASVSTPGALVRLLRNYLAQPGRPLPAPPVHLTERTYELLERNDDMEIWAIHWPPDSAVELHDHGGATGALLVVDGTLEEHSVTTGTRLARRTIRAGEAASFAPRHIHDVVNTGPAPATSVHAYAPPIVSMNFYRREGERLVVERAECAVDAGWAP